jgi:hypothetical protein
LGHDPVMDMLQFHKLRTAVQVNAFPGSGVEVGTVESTLRGLLMASGLFEEVEVESTSDNDRLVIALCQFRPFFTEYDVAERLESIWGDQIAYPFWEAHTIRVEDGHIEFEAASRHSGAGHYVTVHLVAQKAGIPAQRGPVD